MKTDNQFQYIKSQHLDQVTVLQAQMDDFSYDKHAHEEFSFGVTLTGRQDFFANGAFYRSRPGNIFIFNPEEVHDGQSGERDALIYSMLYVHPDQLAPMLAAVGVKNSADFRIADTMVEDAKLRQYIINIAHMITDKAVDKLQQECQLYQIAERIAQCYGRFSEAPQNSKVDYLLRQVKDFIQDNIQSDLSLEDLSQHANISKYHFLRMFRQQFGITPHQYVLNCRVNRARQDLQAGVDLDDIVYAYGFSDLSHFNRRFKPIFGMTPKQYQQHLHSR